MSNFKKHHKLHSKLLVSITLCITLTLLVSTTVYYFYYIRVEKEQAFEANHKSLTLAPIFINLCWFFVFNTNAIRQCTYTFRY
ncbi:hypothetical protein [Paenibacillus polymyxa]|uniref:hypothetical protein n=1 Tax=Paenibacillus polymyxa TaxID=1406 RepID=UPI00287F56A3|nr:hypothetical protein [Paenibacillus polymyxa]